MDKKEQHSAYRTELAKRMRFLRKRKGYTQAELGDLLGPGKEAYKKQERRGALPNYLVKRFAALVDTTPHFVLTGTAEKDPSKPAAPGTKRRIVNLR